MITNFPQNPPMEDNMKFISWNVNGLRACMGKGFMDSFSEMDADFFCLQETKLQEGQIDLQLDGYYQYCDYDYPRCHYLRCIIFHLQKRSEAADQRTLRCSDLVRGILLPPGTNRGPECCPGDCVCCRRSYRSDSAGGFVLLRNRHLIFFFKSLVCVLFPASKANRKYCPREKKRGNSIPLQHLFQELTGVALLHLCHLFRRSLCNNPAAGVSSFRP